MSNLVWKYRSYPGPTAAHLWGPNDTHSLCGKMKRSVGTWEDHLPQQPRCLLCQRRHARAEQWEKQRRDFVLTDDSRTKAVAAIRAGIALSKEPVTRDTTLAAVLALAMFAVETDVTWTQLHDALRKEYDLASRRRERKP